MKCPENLALQNLNSWMLEYELNCMTELLLLAFSVISISFLNLTY